MILYHDDPSLTQHILSFLHRRDSGENVRLVLAEGDSWFSFGGATSNLLFALDSPDTLIVSCAYPGDRLRDMADMNSYGYNLMLSERFGCKWDRIFLSAGGNDLIANISALVNRGGTVNPQLLDKMLLEIKDGFSILIKAARHAGQNCRIVTHSYDFIAPDISGGWFRAGPWVGKALADKGLDSKQQRAIMRYILEALMDSMLTIPELKVVNTQGTLPKEKWPRFFGQKYWRNEIHPSIAGYELLAHKIKQHHYW